MSEQQKPSLLIIDDDDALRCQMDWALSSDYSIYQAAERTSALQIASAQTPALVTLDLGLPPNSNGVKEGFATLVELLERDRSLKVIVITGSEQRENALKAVELGAYDFFPKPIAIEELRVVLRRALQLRNLEAELKSLRASVEEPQFENIYGTSPQMRDVFRLIRKVAVTDAPVMITGESGTGKELAARAIHRLSRRAKGPFIAINCGAIPESLLESELFGHEKGSFTGAHVSRKGRIECADGGTLLLDEFADLSLQLQVKLLRFLQEQRLERVGGRESISVDVRVLAATNADLKSALASGDFREDLYYRLHVVEICMPPLREREGDVLLLADVFLKKYTAEAGKPIAGFTRKAMTALGKHSWPGNVRELENRVRRAVIMSESSNITPEDLELSVLSKTRNLKEAREEVERDLVKHAIALSRGNLSQAANDLGISRPTLYDLMEKHKIARTDRDLGKVSQ
ncbi:MAG: PEP-CTERM-box response regulator transcription factor [Acidobacteria bacterium]|nr:MAG: PEP-CTERM-box response regulator transcription factor [Acidobacteriota bacterium]